MVEPEVITFDVDERAAVASRMAELAVAGRGWVNLHPDYGDDLPVPSTPISRLFGGGVPAYPIATWVAPRRDDRKPEPATIGLEHPARVRILPVLRSVGLDLPAGWTLRADHPRRGLVVELPSGTHPDDVLDFLLKAAFTVGPEHLPFRWRAEVYPDPR